MEEVLDLAVAGVRDIGSEASAPLAPERHDAAAFPEDADDIALGELVVEQLVAHQISCRQAPS